MSFGFLLRYLLRYSVFYYAIYYATGREVFGLWRVCFPPYLVRPGRRLPVQGLSEGVCEGSK